MRDLNQKNAEKYRALYMIIYELPSRYMYSTINQT